MPTLKNRNSVSRAIECTGSATIQTASAQTPHLSWLEEGNWYFPPTISRSHRQVSPHELQLQETTKPKAWDTASACLNPILHLVPSEEFCFLCVLNDWLFLHYLLVGICVPVSVIAVNTVLILWAIFVYLCVSIPADRSGVPHLPVLDKLCSRAQSGPIRKVFIQKRSHHSWDHQGTWTLWTPAERVPSQFMFLISPFLTFITATFSRWPTQGCCVGWHEVAGAQGRSFHLCGRSSTVCPASPSSAAYGFLWPRPSAGVFLLSAAASQPSGNCGPLAGRT